jgi:ankyrin repeat protein
MLLAAGADPSVANDDHDSALMWAAFQGRSSTAELLIEAGASVDLMNTNGRTPLMEAAKHGHNGICKILLLAGAKVNAQDQLMVKVSTSREFVHVHVCTSM